MGQYTDTSVRFALHDLYPDSVTALLSFMMLAFFVWPYYHS